tara:strand:+ start:6439 stop:7131 length:693 start_codon:yes stop_codon:yes gene_type:complete
MVNLADLYSISEQVRLIQNAQQVADMESSPDDSGYLPYAKRLGKEKHPTIGYGTSLGHLDFNSPVDRQGRYRVEEVTGHGTYDQVRQGKVPLPKDQGLQILLTTLRDFREHQKKSDRLGEDFHKASWQLKNTIEDIAYREGISSSPETMKKIRWALNHPDSEWGWNQAAKEYLNHKGYKRRKKESDNDGVVKRMERNAQIIRSEYKRKNPKQIPYSELRERSKQLRTPPR